MVWVYTCFQLSGMRVPLAFDWIHDIVVLQPAETDGALSVTYVHVRSCLDAFGLWVMEQLDALEKDDSFAIWPTCRLSKIFNLQHWRGPFESPPDYLVRS